MSQGQFLIEKHRFLYYRRMKLPLIALFFEKKKQNMLNYIYLIIYRKKIITALKADTCATSVAKNQKWEVKKWERLK